MEKPSRKLSSFSVILNFVFFSIVGIALIPFIPIKLVPSQVLPRIGISYQLQGSSPLVIEKELTSKLEALLSRVTGVKKIYSSSGNGWGNISIELDKHVDPQTAQFEASSIIRQAWPLLPEGTSYPAISLQASNDDAKQATMSFTIVAPGAPVEIQKYTEDKISGKLAQIKGIYKVNVSGASRLEWRLEYDANQLNTLGISISDIQNSIAQNTRHESLGLTGVKMNNGALGYMRVTLSEMNADNNPENFLKSIEIKKINDRIIKLGDLVSIKKAEATPTGYYRINGLNTIYMTVVAAENVNQLQLSDKVNAAMVQVIQNLPAGYIIETAYDAADYIREELRKIYFRTGLTILILFVFVLIVYRRLEYILLIGISLAMNIAISLIFYFLFRIEIQLYSLAGITISLTLIIDNVIIISDELIHRNKTQSFLAILAATLTTVGSLVIIFFLDEKLRLNLTDFALVIMINLSVSILITLFLVPALVQKLKLNKKRNNFPKIQTKKAHKLRFNQIFRNKRWLVYFNRFYGAQIQFLYRKRVLAFTVLILLFGLPVFLLPDKVEKKGFWAETYNKTVNSDFFKEDAKPILDVVLGGTWRLFVQKVYNGSYFNNSREETTLYVNASLPNGSTLAQMNFLIQRMEAYIAQFAEVRQFETVIYSANRANLTIRFSKKHQRSGFPYQLKSKLISKSLELGGGSWSVYGVGDGFSNDMKENAGSYRATLYGYNYDDLYEYASKFKTQLLTYRRIKEVLINPEFSWYKDDYQEFGFNFDKEKLSNSKIEALNVFNTLRNVFAKEIYMGYVFNDGENQQIKLNSAQSALLNIWDLENSIFNSGKTSYKIKNFATIEKIQSQQKIVKENQQYKLCVQYEYIGAYEQGHKVHELVINSFRESLPAGYNIKNENEYFYNWGKKENNQYWLIGIVFAIIFFCSSVLFNSVRQALYVIFIIPISFIGVFLTFYWFKLNFDQGGFAAFIILSGIVVNTNIYLLYAFKSYYKTGRYTLKKAYLKAWNAKFRPTFLAIVSTVIGFIPFIIGYQESFWYPLAAGTIGGLLFSFVAVYVVLPIMIVKEKKH